MKCLYIFTFTHFTQNMNILKDNIPNVRAIDLNMSVYCKFHDLIRLRRAEHHNLFEEILPRQIPLVQLTVYFTQNKRKTFYIFYLLLRRIFFPNSNVLGVEKKCFCFLKLVTNKMFALKYYVTEKKSVA